MAEITSLVLTRHGEAHCNVAGIAGGTACTGLTDAGRRQVHQLAERLRAEEPADVLNASPRQRTVESADILATALGLAVHVAPGLCGPDHGQADGQPWDEIIAAAGTRASAS